MMHLYSYDGPVLEFDQCVAYHWVASTYAVSEKKARSNLAFQYKRDHKKLPSAKITLTGKIKRLE